MIGEPRQMLRRYAVHAVFRRPAVALHGWVQPVLADAEIVHRLFAGIAQAKALAGHPQADQVATLARLAVQPHAGLLAGQVDAHRLAGLPLDAANPPLLPDTLAIRQQQAHHAVYLRR